MIQRKSTQKIIGIFFFLFFILSLTRSAQAEQQTAPLWTPEDVVARPTVAISDISSDGKYTLMGVSYRSIKDGKSIEFSQCTLINNESLEKKIIGDEKNSCVQPYFIKSDEKFTYIIYNNQTYKSVLCVEETGSPKKRQIQEIPSNLINYRFAPDSKSFAFILEESPQTPARSIEGERQDKKQSLYLQKVDVDFQCIGEPQQLTSSKLNMASLSGSSTYIWSPNSQKIALVTQKPGWNLPAAFSLAVLNVDQGTFKTIDETRGVFTSVRFSPDSQKLAFIKGEDFGEQKSPLKPLKDVASTIQIIDLNTGKAESFSAEDIWNIAGWTADGQKIVGIKQVGTKQKIYQFVIQSKELTFKELQDLPVIHSLVFSQNQKHLGFLGENFYHPSELYVTSFEDFNPKQIRTGNEKINLSQIQAKSLKWKSFDGVEIEGILVYPQNYIVGQKVPLIVSIHGGPSAVESEGFVGDTWFGSYCPAVFSSLGYATLVVNYRGSIGYGTKFSNLNYQDLGRGDYQDIMAGIDFLIKEGIADPDQLFITGHSYGGFMTAWAVGHTNRFKAAVMSAGISDWISHVSLTDAPRPMEALFGGFYWDNYDLYRKASPLSYVDDIKTPTLILQGAQDQRVPISQAQQMYQALQGKNVPTQLLLYVNQAHDFSNPLVVIDSLKEKIKWFDKYKK